MHRNNTETSHANIRYAKSLTPSPTVANKIDVLLQARPLLILRPCKAGVQNQGLYTNSALIGYAYVYGLVMVKPLT